MDDNALNVTFQPGKGRKKERQPENWKVNVEKRKRHVGSLPPLKPSCGHNNSAFKCDELTTRDINHFHKTFYSSAIKTVQDCFVLKYTSATLPTRQRSRIGIESTTNRKSCSIKYFVKKSVLAPGKKPIIPVCRTTFLNILRISKDRVQRICKNNLIMGSLPTEKRGDRLSNKFTNVKESIKNFISKLSKLEKHYCRGKNQGREYVSSDLNVNKIWRHYNNSVDALLKVKKSYFRNYFNKNFNIGFGVPSTDACSQCIMLKEKISITSEQEKIKHMTELRVHKLRASAFYKILNQNDDTTLIMSYDCQKNLVLPKVPDQSAYYSRQIYYFNFTICVGCSTDCQNENNTFLYVWKETDAPKGSNEIASAVYHRLCSTDFSNTISTVKLVSDGCGGQNKNTVMVAMISYWLINQAPRSIKEVCLVFPVVGHSFIPPDRVFGRIERVLRKKDTIVLPEEYVDIFKSHGTVFKHGEDSRIYDWKSAKDEIIRLPSSWHFKFNLSKRMYIKRTASDKITVRGEQFYRNDFGQYCGICKKGKKMEGMVINDIDTSAHTVKKEKINDVDKLLKKHFGDDWRQMERLQWYKNVIDNNNARVVDTPAVEEILCEYQEEDNLASSI